MKRHQKDTAPAVPQAIAATELAYLHRLHGEAELAKATLAKFVQHLSESYQLGPQDKLQLDGVIVRAEVKAEG